MVSLIPSLLYLLLLLPLHYNDPSLPAWQLDRTAELPVVRPSPPLPAIAKGRPPRYRIVALPPRFSVSDTSQAINDRTEVVGYVWLSDDKHYFKELRPAVWSQNKLLLCPGWSQTKNAAVQARAINNKGDVLIVSEGWPLEDGVLRSNTTTSFLAPGGGIPVRIQQPVSDQTGFGGEGINDAGEIAGPLWYQPGIDRIPLAEDSGDGDHAGFLYPNGTYVKLFGQGIYAINERAELVGSS
ncbi:MAG: hypothetical protein H8F28_27975, partial [Fibrella sp.]|nr:hypothetical protein [Armatimonadota bacterium]